MIMATSSIMTKPAKDVYKRQADAYYLNRADWDQLVQQAMGTDVSWNLSADQYTKLYNEMD